MSNKNRMKRGKEKSTLPVEGQGGRIHKEAEQPDDLLRFSFRHFRSTEKFDYPKKNLDCYLPALLERLRDLSDMKVSEFRQNRSTALRIHTHGWEKTTEPSGYDRLSTQLQQCKPWQFCLFANEHGRVHGILIDEVFYVV